MIETFESEILEAPDVCHGFFTNRGGVSKGIYNSLNAGLGTQDDAINVTENRRRARSHLSIEIPPLCTLYQCHSDRVIEITEPWPGDERVKADAMVTRATGLIIGILTADCVPVLLADPETGVIAAAHAGWKGALRGILENTVSKMESMGAQRSSIRAATGPSIQQASYEVGPELRQAFLDASTANAGYFLPGERGHFQFDLVAYVESRLLALGIGKIRISPLDTYGDATKFFSYRRAAHRNEPDYGRQLSAICKIG